MGDGWKIAHPEMDTPKTIVYESEVVQKMPQSQQKLNIGFINKQKQIPQQPLPQIPMKH